MHKPTSLIPLFLAFAVCSAQLARAEEPPPEEPPVEEPAPDEEAPVEEPAE